MFAALFFLALAAAGPGPAPAGKRATPAQKGGLTFDVVLEEVDLAGNTVTARAYCHVIPPSGSAGGAVYRGSAPPGARLARYERLPVMPSAGLRDKRLRPGERVTLRLGTPKSGALVVIDVERHSGFERVGMDWLDAQPAKEGPLTPP